VIADSCAQDPTAPRRGWLERLVARLLPETLARADASTRRRARLVVLFSLSIFLCGPGYGAVYLALGMPISAVGAAVAALVLGATPFIQRRTGSVALGAHLVAFGCFAALALVTAPTGGLAAPAVAWLALVPVTALMLGGKRAGMLWSAISCASVAVYFALALSGHTPASEAPARWLDTLRLVVNVGLVGLIALLAWLYESQKDRMFDELRAVNADLAHARDEAQAAHRDARRLLDNVAQGLVIADREGALRGEQSRAVASILGDKAGAVRVGDLFREENADFAARLELGWSQLFEDALPLELTLDQMPSTCRLGKKTLRLGYVPIMHGDALAQVLVVITDDTAEAQARALQQRQREQLEVFQWLVKDGGYFTAFYAEASELAQRIESGAPSHVEMMRLLHTLKGNASFFGLDSLATCCHELESELSETRGERLAPAEAERFSGAWSAVRATIDPLIAPWNRDGVTVARRDYDELLRALAERDPALYERARRWCWETTEAHLTRLEHQAKALAERILESELRVVIEDDGARLPPGEWSRFWSSAIHVVRNAIDHGIEPPDERSAAGKPLTGGLCLRALVEGDRLRVELEDDGRGIDWERVRERSLELGVPASNDRDLERAIFADGLSTRSEVTEISGRGVGMAAVLATCHALGGAVAVRSTRGAGTCVSFTFPLDERPRAA
jgi:HPt (histidine-containing phosphotransfer) domain-containing protein